MPGKDIAIWTASMLQKVAATTTNGETVNILKDAVASITAALDGLEVQPVISKVPIDDNDRLRRIRATSEALDRAKTLRLTGFVALAALLGGVLENKIGLLGGERRPDLWRLGQALIDGMFMPPKTLSPATQGGFATSERAAPIFERVIRPRLLNYLDSMNLPHPDMPFTYSTATDSAGEANRNSWAALWSLYASLRCLDYMEQHYLVTSQGSIEQYIAALALLPLPSLRGGALPSTASKEDLFPAGGKPVTEGKRIEETVKLTKQIWFELFATTLLLRLLGESSSKLVSNLDFGPKQSGANETHEPYRLEKRAPFESLHIHLAALIERIQVVATRQPVAAMASGDVMGRDTMQKSGNQQTSVMSPLANLKMRLAPGHARTADIVDALRTGLNELNRISSTYFTASRPVDQNAPIVEILADLSGDSSEALRILDGVEFIPATADDPNEALGAIRHVFPDSDLDQGRDWASYALIAWEQTHKRYHIVPAWFDEEETQSDIVRLTFSKSHTCQLEVEKLRQALSGTIWFSRNAGQGVFITGLVMLQSD